ncbi:MAG TPA: tRNA pseudouridine(55) synthase TruB [Longimicrobiales bacterium]|nr:tRNA pseudouridine(55) synthase TruB [Longimicrobiales bacterium]
MAEAGPEGVLLLDKPEGPTSHDMVARVRRALGTRRVGHTGTLDPFASGLLLLCVGRATRIAEYLSGLPKTYTATARLGQSTDTLDATGAVVSRSDAWRGLESRQVVAAFRALEGDIQQVPPAFSAKKVAGERLYRRARRGEQVQVDAVPVTVHSMAVRAVSLPEVTFEVECSSGTYVRALARDAGESLGVGAHLVRLRRTRVGRHDVTDAVPADALDDAAAVARAWLDPLDALSHLPRVEVDAAGAGELGHGRTLPAPPGLAEDALAVVAHAGQLLAMGSVAEGRLRPRKVFVHG